MITAVLLTSPQLQAIPACKGIDLAELKKKFVGEVHDEHDYKAFKPYKWKICARTLGTTLYKAEKDKEEQAQSVEDNEGVNKEDDGKPDENNEGEGEDRADENNEDKKLSALETDIANHYLHQVYPNYPLV